MKRLLLAAGVFVAVGVHETHATGYTYSAIVPPGAVSTQPTSMSTNGNIVGVFTDASNIEHSFLQSNGTATVLDVPNGNQTIAFSVNDNGQVVGTFGDANGQHGFIYSAGTYTTYDYPGRFGTDLLGINNSGVLLGTYSTGRVNGPFHFHLFVDDHGTLTTIRGEATPFFPVANFLLSSTGAVTGIIGRHAQPYPFLFKSGHAQLIEASHAAYISPLALSSRGYVVGYYIPKKRSDGAGFVFKDNKITKFSGPDSNPVALTGINDSNEIVGYEKGYNSQAKGPYTKGFSYKNGRFSKIEGPVHNTTTKLIGVSNDGLVVGYYFHRNNMEAFVATPN